MNSYQLCNVIFSQYLETDFIGFELTQLSSSVTELYRHDSNKLYRKYLKNDKEIAL